MPTSYQTLISSEQISACHISLLKADPSYKSVENSQITKSMIDNVTFRVFRQPKYDHTRLIAKLNQFVYNCEKGIFIDYEIAIHRNSLGRNQLRSVMDFNTFGVLTNNLANIVYKAIPNASRTLNERQFWLATKQYTLTKTGDFVNNIYDPVCVIRKSQNTSGGYIVDFEQLNNSTILHQIVEYCMAVDRNLSPAKLYEILSVNRIDHTNGVAKLIPINSISELHAASRNSDSLVYQFAINTRISVASRQEKFKNILEFAKAEFNLSEKPAIASNKHWRWYPSIKEYRAMVSST